MIWVCIGAGWCVCGLDYFVLIADLVGAISCFRLLLSGVCGYSFVVG